MKALRKNQLNNVAHITAAYVGIGVVISLYDHFLLHSAISKGTVEPYSLVEVVGYNISSSFFGGVFGGLFLTTLNQKARNKPFLFGQVIGAISFLTIFIFLSFLTETISTYFELLVEERRPGIQMLFQGLTFDSLHFKNLIVWGIVFQLTQFYLQLQQKFGPGNMGKIFFGKYHSPKTESRVFMFLDLKSSTYIAEKLGESKYHEFLRDVFADITEPISNNKAEIYQYVGDEVVVSWPLNKIGDRSQCIDIYFDIEKEFSLRKEKYLKKYQVVPFFKAGAHIGDAIAGEIGVIKRDITYSGDLLNTTSRIQSKCNELNSRFLISGKLKEYLDDVLTEWRLNSKGFITLKGKQTGLELFSISN